MPTDTNECQLCRQVAALNIDAQCLLHTPATKPRKLAGPLVELPGRFGGQFFINPMFVIAVVPAATDTPDKPECAIYLAGAATSAFYVLGTPHDVMSKLWGG